MTPGVSLHNSRVSLCDSRVSHYNFMVSLYDSRGEPLLFEISWVGFAISS
jgi:hypothetical protein